jgi:hypothetical protein
MKYLSTIILGFSVLLLTPSAYACSCADNNHSFIQNAEKAKLVIRGKVLEYHWYKGDKSETRPPLAMTVAVKEVYAGATTSKTIMVWGDNGIICRPYVSQFPVGTEWVLALSPDSWSKKGELAISSCGEYSLKVNGSNVMGKVIDGSAKGKGKSQVMSLPSFRKLFKSTL